MAHRSYSRAAGVHTLPDKPLADIAGLPMIVRVAQRARAVEGEARRRRSRSRLDHRRVQAVRRRSRAHPRRPRLRQRQARGACTILGLDGDDASSMCKATSPSSTRRSSMRWRPCSTTSAMRREHRGACDRQRRRPQQHERREGCARCAGDGALFQPRDHPWSRDAFAGGFGALPPLPLLRHIGIYGYRAGFLRAFRAWRRRRSKRRRRWNSCAPLARAPHRRTRHRNRAGGRRGYIRRPGTRPLAVF